MPQKMAYCVYWARRIIGIIESIGLIGLLESIGSIECIKFIEFIELLEFIGFMVNCVLLRDLSAS